MMDEIKTIAALWFIRRAIRWLPTKQERAVYCLIAAAQAIADNSVPEMWG